VTLSKGRWSVSVVISLLVAVSVPASGATAAVFTSIPPETLTEGEGPVGWAFESDAPGTMWGGVTWKVSTEPEWHMCGGLSGTVTLEGLAAGTYWVEIADEIDLGFAGESSSVTPFTRCSEPHLPALGPLHPVTLSTVAVLPRIVVSPTATDTVVAIPAARPPGSSRLCRVGRQERRETRAAIRRDLRRLRDATTKAERDRWRRRLTVDREPPCSARSAGERERVGGTRSVGRLRRQQ
jgi:hypothetical protein